MDISRKILKEKFNKFNAAYFNNEICECNFSIKDTNDYVGRFIDENVVTPIICIAKTDFLNNESGWDEDRLDNALLHEMIHALIYTRHGYKSSIGCHGIEFRAISTKIYFKYGVWIGIGGVFNIIERKWSSLTTMEKVGRILLTPINSLLMFIL